MVLRLSGKGVHKWKRRSVDAPSRDVPSLSVFLPKSCQRMSKRHAVTSWRRTITSHDVMTSYCDVMWRHMTSGVMTNCVIHPSETSKITFFNLATLTFDLWPWPLNLSEIISRSTPPPNFGSVCQMVQPWERSQTGTHTHTHRRDWFHNRGL